MYVKHLYKPKAWQITRKSRRHPASLLRTSNGQKKFDGTKGAAESHLSKILIKIRLIMHR
jgi:hypothetical protein